MKHFFSTPIWIRATILFRVALIWMILSNLILLYEYMILKHYECDHGVDFQVLFVGNLIVVSIAGLIGGRFVVWVIEHWFRTKPYGEALFKFLLSYTVIWFFLLLFGSAYIKYMQLGQPLTSEAVISGTKNYMTSIDAIKTYFVWLFIVLFTIIALIVNDKYGRGVFRSFLMGKYFRPQREERIFMFLDLRSSTTIAEQLGEEQYFNFVNTVFKDVTPAILYTKGEIYKYMGDEIIISWKMKRGLKDANCIRCFQNVEAIIRKKAQRYERTYGVVPEFKAGLHAGFVMAGELGTVKRDIAFSGDVLNTASRIQSECNDLGVNLLFSEYLFEQLRLRPGLYEPHKVGDILLKGKQEQMTLYTIS